MVRPGRGFGPRRVMKKASEVLKERAEALAESRTIKPVKGDCAYDFLQAMMDARTPDGHCMTAERIQTELFVIMSAGTEGFGSTASGLMVEVLSHPTILERVLAEIKGAAEAGKLSYPVPTYAEVAQHLPFYVACVQESLRLHPLTSSLLPREITVSDPELVVNGRVIPIGTEVACNAWICGRDRALYGPDAEEYNPDRWLSDPEHAKTYEKYNFSFGYGPRTCIGKHLAKAMLYKTLVALLMKFRVTVCEESWQTPKPSNRLYGPNLLWENVWLNLEERQLCHFGDGEESPSASPDTREGVENSGDKSAEVVHS
ncbi:hypothetical protein CNMCM6805_005705 [Aspergillus fumigatiaffinis]|uniref:Cytochrome P450 monooxygenase n=1 Tax=Aspergillus fumigatiaffinis TaxID=340414 RepID=A0A8H4M2F0_9EURO|nr:hypothetical protein CNMCM6805_005705 [Aspergillus fumigatiaffinis]